MRDVRRVRSYAKENTFAIMETEGNSLELPPLEKLTLASSKTQGEAAPDHGQDLERKEQEGENVSEVSGIDGKTDGNDQVTESSKDKPGTGKIRVGYYFGSNLSLGLRFCSVSYRGFRE